MKGYKFFMSAFGCVAAIGLIYIIGSVGASDLDVIDAGQLFKQLIEGMAVFITGLAGLIATQLKEDGEI